jgi:uncharacterized protein YkwD
MTDLRTRCHIRVLLVLALLSPACASAGVIDAINVVRDVGCDGHPGGVPPLHESAHLDEVAHRLSQGAKLQQAQQIAGYHAVSSFAVDISNVPPSGDVESIISRQFCQQSTNPAFTEIGTWSHGSDVWIALAEPFTPPAPTNLGAISHQVLELTNRVRALPQRCGATPFAAAPPLALNARLGHVALDYAREMAAYGYMNHTGRDGSSPQQRITRGGYHWVEVGENLASGIMTPEDVVEGWLHSPEHCANLMDPLFREMGVAFAVNPHNNAGVYWAMELGTPP